MAGTPTGDLTSTAYIISDETDDENKAVSEIMKKKAIWEKRFPNKKIVSITFATGDTGGYGHPYVAGLLIHYETTSKAQ